MSCVCIGTATQTFQTAHGHRYKVMYKVYQCSAISLVTLLNSTNGLTSLPSAPMISFGVSIPGVVVPALRLGDPA